MTSPLQWVNLTTVKTRLASSQRPEAALDALYKRNSQWWSLSFQYAAKYIDCTVLV
ncbi:hypothetical protein H6G06_05950 [Anabaena sphaerica FACHB-251]|uniref:Uncharacterized protein n=1 Tax=Anabaena sphaerica FACHB-251 TaxID=2692883 RepID=A0A926WEN6_9NOST|nr:hypothetical protein [Anabaena sphaerica]MBD2293037.1 hypothetical protein [Anabaena sphaerica FACHB-251]